MKHIVQYTQKNGGICDSYCYFFHKTIEDFFLHNNYIPKNSDASLEVAYGLNWIYFQSKGSSEQHNITNADHKKAWQMCDPHTIQLLMR